MPKNGKLNDRAWERLFNEQPILQDIDANGIYRIPASVITDIREARLMTKIDHKADLPQIFATHRLAILPDTRGSYVIGRFECYKDVSPPSQKEIQEHQLPIWIESIDPVSLTSEPLALLCAYQSEMIADVLGEDQVQITVFGRMSTGTFDFSIQAKNSTGIVRQPLRVDKAQCEIDGGFEGAHTFGIVEAKIGEIQDFHIRQLYYPYRLWSSRMRKRVVPIFLTYSNDIFTFSVYDFTQLDDYNSLRLVETKRYRIVPTEIEVSDIRNILAKTKIQTAPKDVPFPQADRFERVLDILIRLSVEGTLTQEAVTASQGFVPRQTNYYIAGARYLGLVQDNKDKETGVYYSLTAEGVQIMNKAIRARNLALIERILSRAVFRDAAEYYLANGSAPKDQEVVRMMRGAGLSEDDINDTTAKRRALSVRAWVRWIMDLTTGA